MAGLMWSKCLFGQSGDRCEKGSAFTLSFVDAINKARGSELASYKNWRIPKIDEIETLIGECSVIQQLFPSLTEKTIWSAAGNIDFNTKAWAYNLKARKREIYSRDSEKSF